VSLSKREFLQVLAVAANLHRQRIRHLANESIRLAVEELRIVFRFVGFLDLFAERRQRGRQRRA